MTLYVRIGLPMCVFSKMYSALSMCGLVDELRDGSGWLNMDTNGGVLKDMPRTKSVYTTKSKDDLLVKEYDPNRYPNTPINVWLHNHAKANRNNIKNSLEFTFCDACKSRNMITTQPECDSHYKDAINYITHAVRLSYLGVIEVRNKIGQGVIFLDGNVSALASPTSPGPRGCLEPVPEPKQPHDGGSHEQAGGVREDLRGDVAEQDEQVDDDRGVVHQVSHELLRRSKNQTLSR
ncbi:hypothetical protein AYO21_12143 [Fonsecaea monophora]|uniref:Uncharacterized protein n=1 Tax=Fonsecaea monophora TaxID=254056 RepID=A0A177EP66_9EURO|nr:hypothetical protein AYO21_12143 [Fonsecaea monophora]OAG33773.1 hypothetical protein AYO21_12143 [Fonsecaea monophora]